MSMTTGISNTTPTSKNSGNPMIMAMSAIAHASFAFGVREMIESTI